jgi:hypothetical protein
MPNFFSSPLINQVPNYEPPGYSNLRNWMMNQIGSRSMNPYGFHPNYGGPSSYFPYAGRGQFNPYGGGYGGGGNGGWMNRFNNPNGGSIGGAPSGGWGGYGMPGGPLDPSGMTRNAQGQLGYWPEPESGGRGRMGLGNRTPMIGQEQPALLNPNHGQGGYGGYDPTSPTGYGQGPYGGGGNGVWANGGFIPRSGGGMFPGDPYSQNMEYPTDPGNMPGGGGTSDTGNAGQGQTGSMNAGGQVNQLMDLMRRRRTPMIGGMMGGGGMGPPGYGQNTYDPYGGVGFSAYNIFQNQMGGPSATSPGASLTMPHPGGGGPPVGTPAAPPGPPSKGLFDGTKYDAGSPGNPLPGGLPPGWGVGSTNNWGGPTGTGWGLNPAPGDQATAMQNARARAGLPPAPPATTSTTQGATTQGATTYPSARPNQPPNSSYDWYWHQQHDTTPPPPGSPPGHPGGPPPGGPPPRGRGLQSSSGDFWNNYDGTNYSGLIQNDGTNYSGLIQNDGVSYGGMDGSVRFDAKPDEPSLLMKLLSLLHLSQVPQAPAPTTPPPTPTPVPPPELTNEQKREGQKGMNLDTIQKRAEDIINHDGQPYPNESSPMPYDGSVSPFGGARMHGPSMGHIRAPLATPHVPGMGRSPLHGLLSGMASATRRGQMDTFRAGQPGAVFDGTPNQGDPNNGMASPFPTDAQTAGAPMYPWMMPYQGQFTAPMSPEQLQGLGGASQFAGSNPYGNAMQYNNALLGGQYLQGSPYLDQIRQGMLGSKNQQDQDSLAQIASSMAAGGNALSGARAIANQRYLNQSNNLFNQTMGNLDYGNYERERALQNAGVGQAMGLNQGNMGMYSQLMGMGAVPQQLAQHDLNSQYGDWLRQIGAMQQGDQQNMNNAMNLLRINPGGHNPQYGTSDASSLAGLLGLLGGGGGGGILSSLLGGGDGGGLGGILSNLFNSLFGGGGQGPGGGTLPGENPETGPYDQGGYGPYLPNGYDPMTGGYDQYGPDLPNGYDPMSGWDQYGPDPNYDPSYTYT